MLKIWVGMRYQSGVDVGFWASLKEKKLNDMRLSDAPQPITGRVCASSHPELASSLSLDGAAWSTTEAKPPKGAYGLRGTVQVLNTVEDFKEFDCNAAIQQAASNIWRSIVTGEAERSPSMLHPFHMHCYADMKKYTFLYWFAFPALKPPSPFLFQQPIRPISSAFDASTASSICEACESWESRPDSQHVWLLRLPYGDCAVTEALPLSTWSSLTSREGVAIAMVDTSNLAQHPSWLLRNVLLMVSKRWSLKSITVFGLRKFKGRISSDHSICFEVLLPELPADWSPEASRVRICLLRAQGHPCHLPAVNHEYATQPVGWEANAKGKAGPKFIDLGALMDPSQLAESAVDLNLSLMRWRAAPTLDIPAISSSRCLLLGAGTLGCAVGRTLQGWGVRNLTLVDSGRVAFSNPVRQSLYTFQDCLNGGRPKAEAAAEALARVFPGCNARGIELTIPMPGHPVGESEYEKTKQNVVTLEGLIKEHDVVFLLTDTRESRWLPTLLAAVHDKLAVNAALGYDSFLVMRHGCAPSQGAEGSKDAHRLGCYFCNDVVAPLNSTRNRAMDQQCTVSRPGLAPTAGALAVELMAAVLQHPLQNAAMTSNQTMGGSFSPALGQIPHMVRGQLNGFSQQCLEARAFSQCTACSSHVVNAYKSGGWAFIQQVLSEPSFLEELTGLAALHQQTAGLCIEDRKGEVEAGNSDDDWAEL